MEGPSKFKNICEYIEHLKSLTTSAVLEHKTIHYEFARSKSWNIELLEEYLEAAKINVKDAEKLNQEEEKGKKAKQAKEEANKILEELKMKKTQRK